MTIPSQIKIAAVPAWAWGIVAGVAAFAVYTVWRKGIAGTAKDVVSGTAGALVDTAAGVVKGVGEGVFGIPDTDAANCAAALDIGDTWKASLFCPAGTFIKSLVAPAKTTSTKTTVKPAGKASPSPGTYATNPDGTLNFGIPRRDANGLCSVLNDAGCFESMDGYKAIVKPTKTATKKTASSGYGKDIVAVAGFRG